MCGLEAVGAPINECLVLLLLSEKARTPKDKDEVNKRKVCKCDDCVCDLEAIVLNLFIMNNR